MSAFPNFMVAGGVKCGTTSLYYYLKNHPQICVPCKESYLFTPRLIERTTPNSKVHTETSYRALFAARTTSRTLAAGEVASMYLHCHEEVIPEVLRILGDIKIVIILRNPVDRAFSHYNFFVRDARESRSFEEAVNKEFEAIEHGGFIPPALQYVGMGFYTKQVKAFMDSFSQVKVVLFDDFTARTNEVMKDIQTFLGVDAAEGSRCADIYNASGVPKIQWLQRLVFKPTPLKMKIRQYLVDHVIPEEKFAKMIEGIRRKNLCKVAIQPQMHTQLQECYREDILSLQELLGKDLSDWLRK